MSDAEYSLSPEPAPKPTRKRKSDASGPAKATPKKARASASSGAQALVTAVLANTAQYTESSDPDALGKAVIELATYARQLENALAAGGGGGAKTKTPEELEAAAAKLRKAAVSGIKSQMKWRPTCKTGGAKWTYDGVCSDPAVFGALLGLGGPPTFKMKKISKDAFEDAVGSISASARYDNMYITSKEINVRWSDSGEFKFSGLYGIRS
ncbi:hypothetical protein FA95DRAFT_1559222 [Auriscalpium vulgare]|uniref:Uncharacterized protein n=1 Tax=Auriscalpium vulgare TaxID=40419 RepID=A0ACB8RU95_9AGAM|nr:hypothetical protein FA95DRAFT_1559222 [Auriscalpium vulgare]